MTVGFSASLSVSIADLPTAVSFSQQVEAFGYDGVAVQDHPYRPDFGESWTLLSYIAGQTDRLKLLINVACLPVRSPAMVAKAAATLDHLTGGRVELGLGAGWFWDGIASMGFERRTPGESVSALEEAIEVTRLAWREGETVSFSGDYYRLTDFRAGPAGAHPIAVYLGALGPRMLRLTGRSADGWTISRVSPAEVRERRQLVDQAAEGSGRAPGSIRTQYNFIGHLADTTGRAFEGPAEYWVELLSEYLAAGVNEFLFAPGVPFDGPQPFRAMDPPEALEQLQHFAEQVIPHLRSGLGA